MGGSKVTTGWNYKLAWHDLVGLGPLDAALEFRGADKQAWKGRLTSSGAVSINKPMLWGGDKDQGGAVGTLRWMFGEAGQMPNAYLTSVFGPKTAAWRGLATVAYEGGTWGANNPYAQKRSYRVERIVKGWDDDDCWYPEKAPVPLEPATGSGGGGPGVPVEFGFNIGRRVFVTSPGIDGPSKCTLELAEIYDLDYEVWDQAWWFWRANESGLGFIKLMGESNEAAALDLISQGWGVGETALMKFNSGDLCMVVLTYDTVAPYAPPGYEWAMDDLPYSTSLGTVHFWLTPLTVIGLNAPSTSGSASGRFAKNPAHMILFAHTQKWAGRMSRETVDLEQLTAQADWFYQRGFGLCTRRRPKEESPREFIRRIEKVAGCSFSQSFDDGLWHLDVANGIYDLEALAVIADADVLSFKQTSTVLDEAVNSVSVQYFDPERKEKIITPPTRAMGLIAQYGEIHQTYEFPEIPIGRIALEVATRELLASITPTAAFELDVMPWLGSLRRNQYVRLQLPKRGIGDMVCLVVEVRNGKLKSGAVQLKLVQDIYSLPETVYADIELGEDTRPPSTPIPIEDQRAFEAPYINAVANMPAADFAALPADAGYLVGAAVNPGRMRDFTMAVAPDGGAYVDVDDGQFSPSAVAAADVGPGNKLGIPYTDGVLMAAVQVGDLFLWDDELCRVDAVDLTAATLDIGRGCGDTVPSLHLAGSRMFFYQHTAAYDRTQHIEGETVNVKLLTNSYGDQLAESEAAVQDVTFAGRLDRPYPDGNLMLNGLPFYESTAISPTPPGGGGGGGSGGGGPAAPPPMSAGGGPASTEPGPNGGFADDAPYWIPAPTVFDVDVIDTDGAFDDPSALAAWRDRLGAPLGADWVVTDGKAQFTGRVGDAYGYRWRMSLPSQSFPRYAVTVTAKQQSSLGQLASIGIAWGLNTNPATGAEAPNYIEASAPDSYAEETTVTHTWTRIIQAASMSPYGFYTHVNFMPFVRFSDPYDRISVGKIDDVTMTVAEVPVDMTPVTLDHIDFDAGLTGWYVRPDPSMADPDWPDLSTADGAIVMHSHHVLKTFRDLYGEDPIDLADAAGKYVKIVADVWCDDPSVDARGITTGGAHMFLASKTTSNGYALNGLYVAQRGDWTRRTWWWRVQGAPGGDLESWHVCTQMRAANGYTVKVKIISVEVTDEVQD